jgi:hypothetical protein
VGTARLILASFVAQLRDTKENSDMLVSLILTKEMLLVAIHRDLFSRERQENLLTSTADFIFCDFFCFFIGI